MRHVGNTVLKNLLIKKRMLKEAKIDVASLEIWKDGCDPEQRISKAFKEAGLKLPPSNGRGCP